MLEQQKLLTPDTVQELYQVLHRKDEVIRELEEIERRWRYLHEKEAFDSRVDGYIEELGQEIQRIMERAREAEKVSLDMAEGLLTNLKNQLHGLQQAKKLFSAYRGKGWSVQGAFLDKSR